MSIGSGIIDDGAKNYNILDLLTKDFLHISSIRILYLYKRLGGVQHVLVTSKEAEARAWLEAQLQGASGAGS